MSGQRQGNNNQGNTGNNSGHGQGDIRGSEQGPFSSRVNSPPPNRPPPLLDHSIEFDPSPEARIVWQTARDMHPLPPAPAATQYPVVPLTSNNAPLTGTQAPYTPSNDPYIPGTTMTARSVNANAGQNVVSGGAGNAPSSGVRGGKPLGATNNDKGVRCEECLVQHQKCDEAQPVCGWCSRKNKRCLWPPVNMSRNSLLAWKGAGNYCQPSGPGYPLTARQQNSQGYPSQPNPPPSAP